MENLIFGAFATLDGYREGDAANLGRTVYDRCTVVALCSAKAQNPACTVALLTNAPVPEPFRSQLTQGGVEIWDCPFTTYRVPADTNWALAYYKLCAMAWVLENRNFARAAMLDLDTFTQHPLDDLWRECDEAVLLYQVPHAASQTMTAAISRCFDTASSGENHSVYPPVLKNLQHYLFFQSPRVKSGISTGTLPCRTERSLSSVMQDHSAASYTS